jgi:hypothetical protein
MTCTAKKPKSESKQKIVDFYVTSTAYVLFEHGIESEKVLKILNDIEYTADSMTENYVKFGDIQKALKIEYDFTVDFQ